MDVDLVGDLVKIFKLIEIVGRCGQREKQKKCWKYHKVTDTSNCRFRGTAYPENGKLAVTEGEELSFI